MSTCGRAEQREAGTDRVSVTVAKDCKRRWISAEYDILNAQSYCHRDCASFRKRERWYKGGGRSESLPDGRSARVRRFLGWAVTIVNVRDGVAYRRPVQKGGAEGLVTILGDGGLRC